MNEITKKIESEMTRIGWTKGPCGSRVFGATNKREIDGADLLPESWVVIEFEGGERCFGDAEEILEELKTNSVGCDQGEGLFDFETELTYENLPAGVVKILSQDELDDNESPNTVFEIELPNGERGFVAGPHGAFGCAIKTWLEHEGKPACSRETAIAEGCNCE